MESNHVISAPARDDVPERGFVSDKPGDAKSAVRLSLEEAQEMVARYIDPSISLSEELIRDRRAAAARGD